MKLWRMFEKIISRRPKELVPGFVYNEAMDQLAAQYTAAVQELIRRRLDDPFDQLDTARKEVDRLEREHGSVLREYLQPYMNGPKSYADMPKEEYPRWYAASALKSRTKADRQE